MKKIPLMYFILVLLFSVFCQRGQTAPEPGDRQVVIFILDSITYTDLLHAPTPALDRLLEKGAIGLMNTTTASGGAKTAAYLTIGAGTRACGSDTVEPAVEGKELWKGEEGSLIYRRRVGKVAGGSILH
ncbi:MAG: hypothetical protein WBJ02_01540, partial [bacterium]